MPDLATAAREAFAAGWALSDGPMTVAFLAERDAAVAAACEHPHDPAVIEATLQLGHLTGVWATVYDRRDSLLRKHVRLVMAAWNAIVRDLDSRELARQFRSGTYTAPAESADAELAALARHLEHGGTTAAWTPRRISGAVFAMITEDLGKGLTVDEAVSPHARFWKDAGTAAALAWLRRVYDDKGYADLLGAIEDAIRSGMAEGEAEALALAASKQGKTGFSIAKAFGAAYDRLDGDHAIAASAAATLTKIIDGAGRDLGRALAAQAADDSSEDDMASAAGDTATGSDVRSVKSWTDWAVSAAILGGAKALYSWATNGADTASLVNWVTAGDGRVCATCDGYEAASPYAPDDVPDYPHIGCRCSTEPAGGGFLSALIAAFLN